MTLAEHLGSSSPPARPALALLKATELEGLPDMEWLVDGILPAASLAVLYGSPGDGKSFLALDLHLNIAAGQDWRGHKVAQGPSVYVAAEGTLGMKGRTQAWMQVHPIADVNQAYFLFDAVMLHEQEEVKKLMVAIDRLPASPQLIVIDTLAQNAAGVEENSAKDMGLWLRGAAMLRDRYKATVLILHHTAKNGDRERGSGSLKGAADTMMQMQRTPHNSLELHCRKQKEEECFQTMGFVLTRAGKSAVLALEEKLSRPPSAVEARTQELAGDPDVSLTDGARMLAMEFPDVFSGRDPVGSARKRLERAKRGRKEPPPASGHEGVMSREDVQR